MIFKISLEIDTRVNKFEKLMKLALCPLKKYALPSYPFCRAEERQLERKT